ncbi:MAG: hypothetical protein CMQ32_00335 [Gammaproteobacteria bacterium]|nr:hypothetical protein [Gammaproteobacteria bacterium]MCH2343430.1 hypothetical protein [Pseudomonadales bacterium]HAC86611.1 hypothetical protein [Gammaproteobacteria bacterium]HAD71418.1 hypothetical protein [Gammaproteobacteria bacterium]|tara:strand:- start:1517 stop:1834 length:318 start_codon:yes stop_codon:yes gene_type:complete
MSEEKHLDNDPERTLVTLEQLSQTIEVMTNVVNRLRQHLSDQLKDRTEAQQLGKQSEPQPQTNEETELPSYKSQQKSKNQQRESFVVEIKQQETDPVRKSSKTLH